MTTEVLGSTANTSQPWIPDDSTFGARLALIRQRMGWGNVKEAATACGLPTESWRTWERDGVEPRGLTRIARQIADRSGCSYPWLLDGPGLRDEIRRNRVGGGESAQSYGDEAKVVNPVIADRPIDNRPPTRGPDSGPGPRRTSRVARTGRH
jgi:hypothetical protein